MTILASTPSSTASTSIVALSVSISASTSPALTVSPSLLTQRAILPSVIVGDSAGISTSAAIPFLGASLAAASAGTRPPLTCAARVLSFGQHVRPQLAWIRLRAVLRELRRLDDDVSRPLLDLLQLVLVGPMILDQPLAQMGDRIVLGP